MCPAKFTGSAGSRIIFATTRNCRYAELAPGRIPSEASSALVLGANAGEVVKTSTADVAANPRISRAVLNVGGGTAVDVFTTSPAFAPSTNALLASNAGEVLKTSTA